MTAATATASTARHFWGICWRRSMSAHRDVGIAGGDLARQPPRARLRVDEGALLAVVLRHRVRVPVDLAHVIGRRVVVRRKGPVARRAEPPRVAEHPLLER